MSARLEDGRVTLVGTTAGEELFIPSIRLFVSGLVSEET